LRIAAAEILTLRPEAAAAAMAPPPAIVAVAVLVAVALVVAVAAWIRLRRLTAAGDEGRQAADLLSGLPALDGLRLLHGLLRAALLGLIARRKRLGVARQIRLRLLNEARLVLAHEGLTFVAVVVVAFLAALLSAGRLLLLRLLLVIRILLAELFLRGGDQAEIMLGVLIIIFRRHWIARALRVARELDVFLRDVRSGAADFHVGSVRLIDPRQRILAFTVLTAASPHALLTISHDVPVR